jgi:hypothetical protein
MVGVPDAVLPGNRWAIKVTVEVTQSTRIRSVRFMAFSGYM